jgi:hypothetical protein
MKTGANLTPMLQLPFACQQIQSPIANGSIISGDKSANEGKKALLF